MDSFWEMNRQQSTKKIMYLLDTFLKKNVVRMVQHFSVYTKTSLIELKTELKYSSKSSTKQSYSWLFK